MKLNLDIKFDEKPKKITCIIKIDRHMFTCTKKIQEQADRIDGTKRAKYLAYLGAMVKVHGYVCTKKI